jgi:uncharacterized protein (UPF0548 family)
MFRMTAPTDEEISALLARQDASRFSYPLLGCTQGPAPAGYRRDHNRILLGQGPKVFAEACRQLSSWRMFDLSFVRLLHAGAMPQVGQTVAVCAAHLGFYSLNFCRVLYLVDEDGPIRRHGFAYGTLADHAARGEERFLIEWDRRDNSVSYDLLAYSRPSHWMMRLGYPAARYFQRRFARESLAAMAAACKDGGSGREASLS